MNVFICCTHFVNNLPFIHEDNSGYTIMREALCVELQFYEETHRLVIVNKSGLTGL